MVAVPADDLGREGGLADAADAVQDDAGGGAGRGEPGGERLLLFLAGDVGVPGSPCAETCSTWMPPPSSAARRAAVVANGTIRTSAASCRPHVGGVLPGGLDGGQDRGELPFVV
ncbi:hypothetical protein [Dactylosporangium sp. NPDC051541]|uniref:hypothetical protein n=1 Tax=Dactylosporangium sp. NPDC051541 TaxID=3363977 RepID=UPI00378934DE